MIKFHKVRFKNFLSTGDAFTEIILDKKPTTLIIGANGSGKSTLLRLLAGFLKVSSGEITLDNKKITNKNDVIYENFFLIN